MVHDYVNLQLRPPPIKDNPTIGPDQLPERRTFTQLKAFNYPIRLLRRWTYNNRNYLSQHLPCLLDNYQKILFNTAQNRAQTLLYRYRNRSQTRTLAKIYRRAIRRFTDSVDELGTLIVTNYWYTPM
jgi:hypothetical protein